MPRQKILFLCTANSCRSQLAEAIVNARLSQSWQAFSAGSKPAGYVHPLASQVLAEINIHHQGRSKSIDEFQGQSFDLVVTLCDQAEDECPLWLGGGKQVHIPFADPAQVEGSEADKIAAFRSVRDQISSALAQLLD